MSAARRLTTVVLAATVATLLAACGGSTPSPTGPAVTAAPTSAAAATSAGPRELCNTTPGTGCKFEAGSFKSSAFAGGLTLTLIGDNSWTNTANTADLVFLTIGGEGGFGDSGDPSSIVFVNGAPKLPSGGSFAAVSDGEAAKAALGKITGLAVTTVAGAVIDGQAGVTFRVSNTGTAPVTLWQFPTTTAAGSYDLPGGASAEIHWLTIGGAPVIVAFQSPGSTLDAFILDGDPIIKSIKFG